MADNKHAVSLRVRYQETDQMGVVYYSNYLVWFEIARTEFFRVKGLDYKRIEEEDKIYLPVVESYCRYKAPVRYDDVVAVTAELTEIGAARISFSYEVKVEGKLTTLGTTKHTFVDDKGIPVPVPEKVKAIFRK